MENHFPHPCGAALATAVRNGGDPKTVVPDSYVVVHGGSGPMPEAGLTFSGAAGPTLEAAAVALPHGHIRFTTAGDIRKGGGVVQWIGEISRFKSVNNQHVNVLEGPIAVFLGY